jgi:hypothetical protein
LLLAEDQPASCGETGEESRTIVVGASIRLHRNWKWSPLIFGCIARVTQRADLSARKSQCFRLCGDTDTIASLTGQLAGTVVRATGVPHDLFGGVEGSEEIFQIARRFAKFVSAREK